jgi:hypothetical protein
MSLRDIFKKKTNGKKAGEAATTEDTDLVADEAPNDIPFGLDVWVEGVDPVVEYISLAVLYSLTTANYRLWLQYRRNTWSQWSPREDLDGEEQGELAARCEHAAGRYTECQNNELGLRCQYTQHEGIVGDVSLRSCTESCVRSEPA